MGRGEEEEGRLGVELPPELAPLPEREVEARTGVLRAGATLALVVRAPGVSEAAAAALATGTALAKATSGSAGLASAAAFAGAGSVAAGRALGPPAGGVIAFRELLGRERGMAMTVRWWEWFRGKAFSRPVSSGR